ncbi:uncharacterized protein LOC136093164 [Hydra vulgaris]|uniref:uncharacterized protein LOC136093164 n=1 Tax=Hydra vulgaris TaxID=6087 RepID=UPI0032EA75E9
MDKNKSIDKKEIQLNTEASEISVKLVREIFSEMFKKQQKDILKLIGGNSKITNERVDGLLKEIAEIKETCKTLQIENNLRKSEMVKTNDRVSIIEHSQKDIEHRTGIFINEDYSLDTLNIRKTLFEEMRTHRTNVKEITCVGNVKIDNFPKRLQRDGNIGDAFVNKEIADTFNDFFINIGKKLASAIPEGSKSFESFLKKSDSIMDESELLVDELRLAISMLKTNKSASLDEINPDVVKAVSDIIEKPLFIIFNLSLRNGIFPDQLKLAKIIPIYKSGDDSIKSNYKPISILSCFSKVLERIMHNRLYNYLEIINILYHKQFGFRKNHSTEHAVIDLANQILNGFENNSYTLGIFLDPKPLILSTTRFLSTNYVITE